MRVYAGTTLTLFKFHLGDDITGYTLAELLYKKPDATTGTLTPTAIHEKRLDWSPGIGDLDQHGTWEFQAKVTMPTGVVWGEKIEYEIYEPIS